jgi:hypothetical protein
VSETERERWRWKKMAVYSLSLRSWKKMRRRSWKTMIMRRMRERWRWKEIAVNGIT